MNNRQRHYLVERVEYRIYPNPTDMQEREKERESFPKIYCQIPLKWLTSEGNNLCDKLISSCAPVCAGFIAKAVVDRQAFNSLTKTN